MIILTTTNDLATYCALGRSVGWLVATTNVKRIKKEALNRYRLHKFFDDTINKHLTLFYSYSSFFFLVDFYFFIQSFFFKPNLFELLIQIELFFILQHCFVKFFCFCKVIQLSSGILTFAYSHSALYKIK